MEVKQSSYKQIFKSTSLFGGVQVFNIIISIIRSKFVAVLLGPAGIGILGLLTATTGMIARLTSFGLGSSAVKNISSAYGSGDETRIAIIAIVLRRLVWFTGILGALITLILSPWLSELTFGNRKFTLAFIWLSLTLLINQLSTGQLVVLQGMRKLQNLAKANMTGSVLGLIFTLPLYYKFGINGIVPGIIIASLISLARSWYYARKISIIPVKVSYLKTITEGKGMLTMGFMISLSGLITVGTSYIVRIFISRKGGVEEVGLYNAGFNLINTYVGLIFTAMATDYYPRLSAIAHDNKQTTQLINQQSEIAVFILGPILSIFLIFINWVVIILYSTKFVPVNGMIQYAALGMYFKAASWAIGFVLLGKGDSKLFFLSEVIGNTYVLIFNLICYYYWGLDGLGVSFLISYILYLGQVFIIAKIKYEFFLDNEFIKVFILQLFIGILCFFCVKILPNPWSYISGIPLIGFSVWHSFYELNKRVGLISIWRNFINRVRK